jgi:hypothetical protein
MPPSVIPSVLALRSTHQLQPLTTSWCKDLAPHVELGMSVGNALDSIDGMLLWRAFRRKHSHFAGSVTLTQRLLLLQSFSYLSRCRLRKRVFVKHLTRPNSESCDCKPIADSQMRIPAQRDIQAPRSSPRPPILFSFLLLKPSLRSLSSSSSFILASSSSLTLR